MDQFYGWLFDIIIIIIMNEKKTMNQSVEFRIKYVGKKRGPQYGASGQRWELKLMDLWKAQKSIW